MSLENAINALVARLESVTSRLEKVEGAIATGATAGAAPSAGSSGAAAPAGDDGASHPAVRGYDDLINTHIVPFVEKAKAIAPEVGKQAEVFHKAVQAQKAFIAVAAQSQKPNDTVLQQLIKPTSDAMTEVTAIREQNRTSKFFNNLSAVSEGIGALGWVLVSPTPGPHIADMRGGSEFYSNRVLKDFKDKDATQVDFVKHYNTFLKELQNYVKQYHTTGLTWNPRGGDASAAAASAPAAKPSAGGPPPPPAGGPPPPPPAGAPTPTKSAAPDVGALMGALNKGTAVTSGLKKVTDDMKTKNRDPNERSSVVKAVEPKAAAPKAGAKPAAAKKPAKFELEGNKWVVENFDGKKDIVISETEPRHVVYIYGLVNSTVQIKGKVNSIAIDGCKRTAVVFENAISGVEIVNGNSIELQVTGKVPSIAVDKTSGVQIYLSADSLDTSIISSKSDSMNVLLPGQGDADLLELPIPEQYQTVVKGGKELITECVQHAG